MAISMIGKDDSLLKKVTCQQCTTILSYAPIDEKKDHSTDYTGGRDTYSYIKCPSCGNKVVTKNY